MINQLPFKTTTMAIFSAQLCWKKIIVFAARYVVISNNNSTRVDKYYTTKDIFVRLHQQKRLDCL